MQENLTGKSKIDNQVARFQPIERDVLTVITEYIHSHFINPNFRAELVDILPGYAFPENKHSALARSLLSLLPPKDQRKIYRMHLESLSVDN